MPSPICTVSGKIVDASGAAVQGLTLGFQPRRLQGVGEALLSIARLEVTTDEVGAFEIELVQGAEVNVHAPRLGLDGDTITVPEVLTANLFEILTGVQPEPEEEEDP